MQIVSIDYLGAESCLRFSHEKDSPKPSVPITSAMI